MWNGVWSSLAMIQVFIWTTNIQRMESWSGLLNWKEVKEGLDVILDGPEMWSSIWKCSKWDKWIPPTLPQSCGCISETWVAENLHKCLDHVNSLPEPQFSQPQNGDPKNHFSPRPPRALSAPARSRAPLSAPWGRGSRGNPGCPNRVNTYRSSSGGMRMSVALLLHSDQV